MLMLLIWLIIAWVENLAWLLLGNFFNPNSDDTLMVEDKIEWFGVKVYSCPKYSGVCKIMDSSYQYGCPVKLGIMWYRTTICLDDIPPTRLDIINMGTLQIIYKKTYVPQIPCQTKL